MKKSLFIVLILGVLISEGCKKNPLDVNFTVTDSEQFTIPPNSSLGLLSIITPAFSTNSWSGTYSTNNTDKNHLKSLKLKSLTLTITAPSGKTFGFLKSIDIYIQGANQPDTKIASIDNIPANAGSTLTLNTEDVDLSPYAKGDSFTLKVDSTPQSSNTDNVDVTSNEVFDVTASVL